MDLREDPIPEENTELFPQAQEDAQPVQGEEPVAKIAPVEAAEETVAEEPAQCEAESAAPQPAAVKACIRFRRICLSPALHRLFEASKQILIRPAPLLPTIFTR